MKVYKHCGTFVLLTVCTFFVQIHAIDLCGNSWFNYKDDKCYKMYNDMLYTFENAKGFCSEIYENDLSSLVTIRSKEEQEFLMNYVFKIAKKVDNFWIGAKYDNGTFHWVDNSTLGYTNWLKATKNKTDTCVQMQAEEDWVGKWLDVPCTVKSSLVVCQKIQWTRPRLEKAYETAFEQQQSLLDEGDKAIQAQTEIISQANKTIEQAYQTIAQQKHKIEEANQNITKHQNAIDKTKKEFEKFAQQISDSANVLNISLFKGCSFRELVKANFSGSICSSDGICTLYNDQFYSFEMKFVANQDSQTVHVNRLFKYFDQKDNMNEDGCKYVKCPLVKGQEYSFIVDKYQTEKFSTPPNVFQISLIGDKGTLACAYVKVTVLYP